MVSSPYWVRNQAIFLAGNHALCRGDNLSRTSGAKCAGQLVSAADFKHGDYVVDGRAFQQPETGGSHVYCALGVVERIGLVGTAFSQSTGELSVIHAVRKIVQNPCPDLLCMAALFGP